MIEIYNPSKLARQPFLTDLLNYLAQQEKPTLRQIKVAFYDVPSLDKKLDSYIQAGYVSRENRRYLIAAPLLDNPDKLLLDQEIFVETESPSHLALQQLVFTRELTNSTNAVIIREEIDFVRKRLTLSSYFYKLTHKLPLSQEQIPLYQLLGDVNPDYALKYLTTFLLKFSRKDLVLQKRPDIFVQALEILGFIKKVEEHTYRLTMELDKEKLLFYKRHLPLTRLGSTQSSQ